MTVRCLSAPTLPGPCRFLALHASPQSKEAMDSPASLRCIRKAYGNCGVADLFDRKAALLRGEITAENYFNPGRAGRPRSNPTSIKPYTAYGRAGQDSAAQWRSRAQRICARNVAIAVAFYLERARVRCSGGDNHVENSIARCLVQSLRRSLCECPTEPGDNSCNDRGARPATGRMRSEYCNTHPPQSFGLRCFGSRVDGPRPQDHGGNERRPGAATSRSLAHRYR